MTTSEQWQNETIEILKDFVYKLSEQKEIADLETMELKIRFLPQTENDFILNLNYSKNGSIRMDKFMELKEGEK